MKLGYKQTEVGAIPKDWEMLSLSELTEPQRPISYGIVQTGPNIINGVRCLRVLDINEGKINKAELITTSKEISDAYRRTILKAGDLVMPLRGKVGDVGLVDEDLGGRKLDQRSRAHRDTPRLVAGILPAGHFLFCHAKAFRAGHEWISVAGNPHCLSAHIQDSNTKVP
ncbi:hypothetical protein ACVMBZ_003533 [Bradyrhizobium liaoningense]